MSKSDSPFTPAVLHILLALAEGDLHGYGIMKQVEKDSSGEVSMGPGTLYGCLNRMLQSGLVVESSKRAAPDLDDARRIYYRITLKGKTALARELSRYKRVVKLANNKSLANFQGWA